MYRTTCLLLVLLLGMRSLGAGEDGEPLPRTLTDARAAALVLEAHRKGNAPRLKRLAERDSPDPWLVADELCRLGEHEAALAFARAAPRPATTRLASYVAAARSEGNDASTRRVWTSVSKAFGAGDFRAAVAAAGKLEGPLEKVVSVRIVYIHGLSLVRLGQLEEGARLLLRAAEAGRNLGWIAAAVGAFGEGARAAYRRSDWSRALGALRETRTLQAQLGQAVDAARTLATIGLLHEKQGHYAEALRTQQEALAALRKAGDEIGAASTLGNIGIVHMRLGAYKDALRVLREALAFWESRKVVQGVATTLGRIGLVEEKLGDYVGALRTHERALALLQESGDAEGVTRTRANIGNVLTNLGDYPAALRLQEQVLAAKRRRQDRAGEAQTLDNIGVIYWSLADYTRALQMHRRALKLRRTLGDRQGSANSLNNLGVTFLELGDYASALRSYEAAVTLQQAIGDRAGEARSNGNIGRLYMELGDHPKALKILEKTLGIWQALENRGGVAWALQHIGMVKQRAGDHAAALRAQQRALALRIELGDKVGEAHTRSTIGVLRRELGQLNQAVDAQNEAIAQGQALLDPDMVARARGHLGLTYLRMGKPKEALPALEAAVRAARELRITPVQIRFLAPLARLRLELGDTGRALTEAKSAVRDLEDILGGLGEEEGAAARERYVDVFNVGALAAMQLDEKAEAFTFLESGRAGTLLESLKGRRALLWAELPEALRTAEAEAKAQEARARHELERSRKLGRHAASRAAAQALDRARERLRDVSARIQREAKRQAGLFYPRATTLPRLQKYLAPDTAFVLFGLGAKEALALVVTTRQARFVALGRVADIRASCAALDLEDTGTDPAKALTRLKQLLVKPLALGDAVKQLVLSPDGPLCYLPYGALFDERAVTLAPSGTTYVLLREEVRQAGVGVLALGDPLYGKHVDAGAAAIYRGRRPLVRLEATREEVKAVGTVELLGRDASERGLRDSLRQRPRWRAVHLACHGLIDPDRPMLSSLAITREGSDDGFLTCLEVLRAEIPADLVVLSACQTGKGRMYRSEGVLGLMRAFMYAGTPRVLCSLWDVDDRATLALMKKFYALWNPKDGKKGLGAAVALERAQAFIRGHEKWKHPYYWAAWVLWGLPD